MQLKILKNSKQYRNNKYIVLVFIAFLSISFMFQSCVPKLIIPKLVPVQTARISQMEFYRQFYEFENTEHAVSVLKKFIGERNWTALRDNYASGEIAKDLFDKKIEARGAFTITISLVPTNPDSFFVEGIGRYIIVRNTSKEIIITGDFYIKNERYSLEELNNGRMKIKILQYTLRQFQSESANFYDDSNLLEFIIHMKTISTKNRVYSIDYNAKHELISDNKTVGFLEFDKSTPKNDKLIDLRGLNLVKDDYRKILEEIEK